MGIYAAIGVPEIWRYDGKSLTVEHLQADRTYRPVDRSPSFPWLPLDKLVEHLDRRDSMDETRWIKTFRAGFRAELAPIVPPIRPEEAPGAEPQP